MGGPGRRDRLRSPGSGFGFRCFLRSLFCGFFGGGFFGRFGFGGFFSGLLCLGRGGRLSLGQGFDGSHHGVDGHGFTRRHLDLENPVGLGGDFQGDLVGFNHKKRFVLGHRVSILLEPLGQNCFLNRFPHMGDFDFN